MARKIAKVALLIFTGLIIVVAFAGVVSNQGNRTNRVIDMVEAEETDRYMSDEVIKTWYGQIGLTNVEEFGANRNKVAAIIHYKNTTGIDITVSPSDLGTFMDEDFDYTLRGVKDEKVTYEPGESAEFRVHINRRGGLDGLMYLIKEPESSGGMMDLEVDDQFVGTVYQSSIDLNMLNPRLADKKEYYGMQEDYNEREKEGSVGRHEEHLTMMNTIEELILITTEDEDIAQIEEERVQRLQEERRQALETLGRNKGVKSEDEEESSESGEESNNHEVDLGDFDL